MENVLNMRLCEVPQLNKCKDHWAFAYFNKDACGPTFYARVRYDACTEEWSFLIFDDASGDWLELVSDKEMAERKQNAEDHREAYPPLGREVECFSDARWQHLGKLAKDAQRRWSALTFIVNPHVAS